MCKRKYSFLDKHMFNKHPNVLRGSVLGVRQRECDNEQDNSTKKLSRSKQDVDVDAAPARADPAAEVGALELDEPVDKKEGHPVLELYNNPAPEQLFTPAEALGQSSMAAGAGRPFAECKEHEIVEVGDHVHARARTPRTHSLLVGCHTSCSWPPAHVLAQRFKNNLSLERALAARGLFSVLHSSARAAPGISDAGGQNANGAHYTVTVALQVGICRLTSPPYHPLRDRYPACAYARACSCTPTAHPWHQPILHAPTPSCTQVKKFRLTDLIAPAGHGAVGGGRGGGSMEYTIRWLWEQALRAGVPEGREGTWG